MREYKIQIRPAAYVKRLVEFYDFTVMRESRIVFSCLNPLMTGLEQVQKAIAIDLSEEPFD